MPLVSALQGYGSAGPALFVHDPGSNPLSMNGFYYVYIFVSELDDEIHYSGVTTDLRSRLTAHNRGKC